MAEQKIDPLVLHDELEWKLSFFGSLAEKDTAGEHFFYYYY
jgi:hypothetical protein